MKKKILILYAAYGGGHLSAANSIKQCIDEYYPEYKAEIVDFMLYINKTINKLTTGAYKEMAKKLPWAWGTIYGKSEKGPIAKLSSSTFNLLSKKLLHLLDEKKPDIIISTHPFSGQMVNYLKKKMEIDVPLATIMTDFAPHDQWLVGHEYTDYFFVAHKGMQEALIEKGIDKKKIHVSGIPLSNRFLMHFDRKKLLEEFNLDKDKRTILFFGGGEFGLGKSKTLKILKAFISYGKNIQIVAIAGRNEKLKEKFEEIIKEENAENFVQVLGFSNKVPELMSISNLVVTKPGGLTVTESLASGLPIVVINPIPGQEEQNAEFLEESGVAIWIRKKDDPDIEIKNLLSNPKKLDKMKLNTKLLAKRKSTLNICKKILE